MSHHEDVCWIADSIVQDASSSAFMAPLLCRERVSAAMRASASAADASRHATGWSAAASQSASQAALAAHRCVTYAASKLLLLNVSSIAGCMCALEELQHTYQKAVDRLQRIHS